MDGFNIVTVIAIILFARLGVRLVVGYKHNKKKEEEERHNDGKK